MKATKLQMQSQSKKKLQTICQFTRDTVNFNSYVGIKQSNVTNKDKIYKVYSPEKLRLGARDDIYLDLKFDIQTTETLEPWLNLLPSLKGMGLHIENEDWVSKKQKTIQFHCTYLIEDLIIQQV